MANLVIDMGNTLAKMALFDNRSMKKYSVFPDLTTRDIDQFTSGAQVDYSISSNVRKEYSAIEDYLTSTFNYRRFHTGIKSAIKNRYATPETLGPDRLAAVIGASVVFPNKNVLVIDAGTCITYDHLQADSSYTGGSISPGIRMRYQALHHFTEKLPLEEIEAAFTGEYGNDTRTSIISGVQQGILHEVMGFIASCLATHPDLRVILCGGDAGFFESRLKNSIFAHIFTTEPNLVLIGLNEVIFEYND